MSAAALLCCELRRVKETFITREHFIAVAHIPIQKKQAGLDIDSDLKSGLMDRCSVREIIGGCRSERMPISNSYSSVALHTPIPIFLIFLLIQSYFLAVVMSNSPVAPRVSAVLAGKEKLSSVSV